MKALLTSDLHTNLQWFSWILREAPKYDLVCIAGDLLDLFSKKDPKTQSIEATRFLVELSKVTKVAVCSGNHDPIDYPAYSNITTPIWLRELEKEQNILTDGGSEVIGDKSGEHRSEPSPKLAVTCLPFVEDSDSKENFMILGENQARGSKGSKLPWLVLHHVPPAFPEWQSMVWDKRQAADLQTYLDKYQPDYLLCGHIHHIPYQLQDGWRRLIGNTLVFNAGQADGPFPNHIILDLAQKRARWVPNCVRFSENWYAKEI